VTAFAADRDAPVNASGRITIAAPRELVWQVLTDLEGWPAWNPGVKSLAVSGPLAVGATFRWKAGPGTIRSKIEQCDAPSAIGWTGKTFGIRARHAWQLETQDDDATAVTTQESWRGPVPTLLKGSLANTLSKALTAALQALSQESLRRA
jgi:carbon monoxide dehydrogenase subunit G